MEKFLGFNIKANKELPTSGLTVEKLREASRIMEESKTPIEDLELRFDITGPFLDYMFGKEKASEIRLEIEKQCNENESETIQR